MSDVYLEKIAGELADLALADEKRSDDEKIVAEIAEIVGSSSQTLQEAYLTAVRVRRAEKRARALLAERATTQIAKTQRLLTDKTEDGPKPQQSIDARQRLMDSASDLGKAEADAQQRPTTDGNAPIAMPGRPTRS